MTQLLISIYSSIFISISYHYIDLFAVGKYLHKKLKRNANRKFTFATLTSRWLTGAQWLTVTQAMQVYMSVALPRLLILIKVRWRQEGGGGGKWGRVAANEPRDRYAKNKAEISSWSYLLPLQNLPPMDNILLGIAPTADTTVRFNTKIKISPWSLLIDAEGCRAGHFRYFLIFSIIKNYFFAFFIKQITFFCTSPI